MIWASPILLFFLWAPETYRPKIIQRKALQGTPKASWTSQLRSVFSAIAQSCKRPFTLLFHESMVLCLSILTAVLLGVQYLLFGAFAYSFPKVYSFTVSEVGLSFLGIGVGAVAGAFSYPIWATLKRRQMSRNKHRSQPEFALPQVAVGAAFLPVGLFWFGWTCRAGIHWIVPIVGSAFYGIG